ncbi:MAG: alpha/beta hydrolase [Pseudomonadota bacterium]
MMCDARLFEPQVAVFARERAVMVAPLTRADSMEKIAADVLAHAPPRFALAGLSMGGIVAMEVLRQASHRVERLALLDTNPLAEAQARAAQRGPQIERALAGGLRAILRDDMKPHYLSDGPDRDRILALCMAMGEDLGGEVFVKQSVALRARRDQCKTLESADMPSLVLCGQDDRLCPLDRHLLMAELLPNAELVVIEGAGHLPTLEQPAATNAALATWLSR